MSPHVTRMAGIVAGIRWDATSAERAQAWRAAWLMLRASGLGQTVAACKAAASERDPLGPAVRHAILTWVGNWRPGDADPGRRLERGLAAVMQFMASGSGPDEAA